MTIKHFNTSGSKYLRKVIGMIDDQIDVYAVLKTFNVISPARQHAIKKLLCSGLRGKGDELSDLREARDAIDRDIQMICEQKKAEDFDAGMNGELSANSFRSFRDSSDIFSWRG